MKKEETEKVSTPPQSPTHSILNQPSFNNNNNNNINIKKSESKQIERERYIPVDLDHLMENIKKNLTHKLKMSQADIERMDKIQKCSNGLNNDVVNLGITIQNILDKQYEEYLKTFTKFMDTIRIELQKKQKEMEEQQKKLLKENDIRIVKTERDFFRLEAIRLNGLCKEMSEKIEEMAFKMKLLNNDLNNMTVKWKESENVNKQLLVELESNIQSMKEVEKENNEIKEKLNNNLNINNFNNNIESNNNNENENYNLDNSENNNLIENNNNISNNINNNISNSEKLYYIIEKLKAELRKERLRNHKTLSEFNKMILEKNKLESIFKECVDEVRKDIFNRKLKETINNESKKFKTNYNNNNNKIVMPYVSDIKFDKFLPFDKRKVIETFVLNEEVNEMIKNITFGKQKNNIENNNNNFDNLNELKGINILNENRITTPPINLSNTNYNTNNIKNKTKGNNFFIKSTYNFANSFGKKTMLNFGIKKGFKPFNSTNYNFNKF